MYAVPLAPDAELRPLEPWQAEEFLAHIDRARANTDPWIPWATRTTDLASARATLQSYADKQAADGGRLYGIWRAGVLVAGVMFVQFDAAAGNCEIGVWAEPAGQGHGLITVAVRRLIAYAFEERGMHRISWYTSPANLRSQAVAQRVGMSLDGTLREQFLYNGVRQDSQVWSLLAREWQSSRS
ncbi:GNAT family N-acetyltransferase [Streptacidiphilus sp. MAP5-3]|uniref:GNAT family N-acetyltransferase n=1 Tax=unclassified Streptacidiphilus TaxID=2643834 RepID=UPI003512B5F3